MTAQRRAGVSGGSLCFLLASLSAVAAQAHEPVTEHELVLQVDDQGLVGAWRVVARGRQAALVYLAWDLDRNGVLGQAEQVGAASLLLAKLAGRVQVSYAGAARVPAAWQTRLEAESTTRNVLVAEGLAELGAVPAPGELRVNAAADGPGVWLSVQALARWRLLGEQVAPDGQGLVRVVRLAPGEQFSIRVVRVDE